MKDQNSVDSNESKEDKMHRARSLFIESVLAPDHHLRGCAHNQKCFNELMSVREHVISHLRTLRR